MLHTKGYCVHKNVVGKLQPPKGGNQVIDSFIFNNKRKGGDKRRLQAPIIDQDNAFCQTLFNFLRRNYPNHIPNAMVKLFSLPKCQQQVAHADYEPTLEFATSSDDMVPLECLVAFEPGTKLVVWPESIRLACMSDELRTEYVEEHGPITAHEICLEPGDILIFRGDLIHAGAAYKYQNTRVHLYLDSPDVPREGNRTWFPSDDWIVQ